jgi:4-diphosphocytidyl-2-C-methyl-D-erythritol kinase
LVNDFEEPVYTHYPEVKSIKEKLYRHGAEYASMSGSGSTVFGLFNKTVDSLDFPAHYFEKRLAL